MKLMKIFNKIKNFIYKDEVSAGRYKRYRSVFGNLLVSDYELFENASVSKKIMFFSKEIFRKTDDSTYRTYYILGKKIYQLTLEDIFKNKYIKKFKNYDNVFLLWVNSGETLLFLKYVIQYLIKKNNAKKPLILATKKYHCDLIKLYCPDIPYIFDKNISHIVQKSYFKIENINFYSAFPNQHFINLEADILKYPLYEKNYFNPILDLFNCDIKKVSIQKPVIPHNAEKSMEKKIKKIKLNLDNFVFISPEAQSCESIDNKFWIELINIFKKKGYDVFVNINEKNKDKKINLGNADYKTCTLSFCEAFALSKKAKKIIALRSGLCELLVEANVKIDILYSEFKKRKILRNIDCDHVMSGFSFYCMPHVNKNLIKEHDTRIGNVELLKKLEI